MISAQSCFVAFTAVGRDGDAMALSCSTHRRSNAASSGPVAGMEGLIGKAGSGTAGGCCCCTAGTAMACGELTGCGMGVAGRPRGTGVCISGPFPTSP